MKNLQVKNVPDMVHRRIASHARRSGRTIREIVLNAVLKELDRADFQARLARRRPVDLGRPAAEALDEVRAERSRELDA